MAEIVLFAAFGMLGVLLVGCLVLGLLCSLD